MLKVMIHGSGGMMGKTVAKIIDNMDKVEVGAGIYPFYDDSFSSFPVFKTFEECNVLCDVIIDFSVATACDKLVAYCAKEKIPVVLCTTGLSHETEEHIIEASKQVAILKSANMSLGINLMANLLKKMSKVLYDANFDIEIIEKHHNKKLDAPSGTALYLADAIEKGLNETLKRTYDRSELTKKRDKHELGIHSLRGGSIVGEHSVVFAGLDEVIEFTHIANSKEVFAVGAVNAAKFIKNKAPGIYTMEDFMNSI